MDVGGGKTIRDFKGSNAIQLKPRSSHAVLLPAPPHNLTVGSRSRGRAINPAWCSGSSGTPRAYINITAL